ncbi:MAG: hypothetical protein RB296_07730 [Acidobacteriota bacterium]|jgi:hypothetical protein|nr:hypothetical protein [Acidobacteriota bacterium]
MKFRMLPGLIVLLSASVLWAGGLRKGQARAGVMVTAIHHATYIGGTFELGIGNRIALGGDASVWLEGNGGMVLSPHLVYSFPLKVSRLELFAGGGPLLAFGFKGGSDFRVKLFAGARYRLNAKTALFTRLVAETGDGDGLGGALGIDWRL